MEDLIAHTTTQLVEAFLESLGKVFILMIPIGLIYGKLVKKYTWLAIGLAIPIAALLDAIVTATMGADTQYLLLIAAGACLVGIEIASIFFKRKKQPDPAV